MAEKTIATLTIHRASEMTPKGRKDIAAWLRMHAESVVKNGKNYSKRYSGKYIVMPVRKLEK